MLRRIPSDRRWVGNLRLAVAVLIAAAKRVWQTSFTWWTLRRAQPSGCWRNTWLCWLGPGGNRCCRWRALSITRCPPVRPFPQFYNCSHSLCQPSPTGAFTSATAVLRLSSEREASGAITATYLFIAAIGNAFYSMPLGCARREVAGAQTRLASTLSRVVKPSGKGPKRRFPKANIRVDTIESCSDPGHRHRSP